MVDPTPDYLLSWPATFGILAALGAVVAVFYSISPDFATFGVRLALAFVCFGVPVLMNLQARKEQFLDDFDRSEGR